MFALFVLGGLLLGAEPPRFEKHMIDAFPAGYQVAVADLNGDGRPDVIALSTDADRVDWYENPSWRRHPLAHTAKNIDLAVRDLDGSGRPMIALASGFYFNQSGRGGQIELLRQPEKPGDLWPRRLIATDPVVHRLRWADVEGNGRPVLIHAPIFGPGSNGPQDPKPAHLWAFRPRRRPAEEPWQVWKIDETLTVLHGIRVVDLDCCGRDAILTASFEGIHRFDYKGQGRQTRWRKVQLAAGAPPVNDQPGAARGTSEVAVLRLAKGRLMLAAIEPWHGHQVVVYSPPQGAGLWQRQVIDDTLQEGHALVTADFDGDGQDEIVAGWRAGGGGLRLYKATDATGREFKSYDLDPGMPAEGAVAADINGDGKPDLVVIGGRPRRRVPRATTGRRYNRVSRNGKLPIVHLPALQYLEGDA
ncbi:MAG: VCBS repeat-containing protein [Thermoguttaceae bacterium]